MDEFQREKIKREREIFHSFEKMYGIKCEDIAWCTFNTFLILSAHNHPDPGTGPNTQNKINGSLFILFPFMFILTISFPIKDLCVDVFANSYTIKLLVI